MNVIVMVDDNAGMMFNNRRQSRDKTLIDRILQLTKDKKIWMNKYSAGQFEGHPAENIIIDEDFLNKALPDDFCLVENIDISGYENKINRIILFKWNRKYPADKYFTIPMDKWTLNKSIDFAGNSHDKITLEEYIK